MEQGSMDQIAKITRNFKQLEDQLKKEGEFLKDQLEQKKKENSKLEKSLFEERRSNKILMNETQSMSRRSTSRISSSAETNAQEYIQNFLRLEKENQNLKVENKLLLEEMVFLRQLSQDEQDLIFASVLGFAVNQRAFE